MDIQSSFGGEQSDKEQMIGSFDRRHPNRATLDYLLSIEIELPANYERTRRSMEEFFAAGHPRPEHGDESY